MTMPLSARPRSTLWGICTGNIGTGALNAFADKLTGYNLFNGAFGAEQGSDLYLTIDARYNYEAYEALNGHAGHGGGVQL